MSRCILAIDPGTHCGWALRNGKSLNSGTWDLAPRRYEGAGMRYLRFRKHLNEIADVCTPELVVFEEVHRHAGTDAAHIYGGIRAELQSWCEAKGITTYSGLPVGTIKKHATGKGNAKKPAMVEAAQTKWPGQQVADDNQADALWMLDLAEATL